MRKVPRLSKVPGFSCLEFNAKRRLLRHTTCYTRYLYFVLSIYIAIQETLDSGMAISSENLTNMPETNENATKMPRKCHENAMKKCATMGVIIGISFKPDVIPYSPLPETRS